MTAYFCSSLLKIRPGQRIDEKQKCILYLAANQHASCQIVVQQSGVASLVVDDTDLKRAGFGVELFEERFIRCGEKGLFPDPLVPVENKVFHKEQTVLYLRIYAPKEMMAGFYNGRLRIKNDFEECALDVCVRVWGFAIPETPACKTAFGLERQWIAALHGVPEHSEECQQLYERYYEELLRHKISPYRMPYPVDDPRATVYMDDPRVVSFQIDELRVPYSTQRLKKCLDILRSKKTWFKKGFFYPIDEPKNKSDYQELEKISRRLASLEPNYRLVLPHYCPPVDKCYATAYDGMLDKVTIWCPESCLFDDANYWTQSDEQDLSLAPKLQARCNAGDEVWWYVCCGPAGDYCNFFITMEAIRHRLLFTQQWMMGVQGLLYWDVNWWGEKDGTPLNPWDDMATVKFIDPNLYGDGSLLYNGTDGPVSSLRLETIRDGIDDFEYLCLAEKLFGREKTLELVSQIVTSLTAYTADPEQVMRFYQNLGQMIEQALGKEKVAAKAENV